MSDLQPSSHLIHPTVTTLPVISYAGLHRNITPAVGSMVFSKKKADSEHSKYAQRAAKLFFCCDLNPHSEINRTAGKTQVTFLLDGILLLCENKGGAITLVNFIIHDDLDPTPPDNNPGNTAPSLANKNGNRNKSKRDNSSCYFVKRLAATLSIEVNKLSFSNIIRSNIAIFHKILSSFISIYTYRTIPASAILNRSRLITLAGAFECCKSAIAAAAATALSSKDLRTTNGHGSTLDPANC
jgi:hypothetical protein